MHANRPRAERGRPNRYPNGTRSKALLLGRLGGICSSPGRSPPHTCEIGRSCPIARPQSQPQRRWSRPALMPRYPARECAGAQSPILRLAARSALDFRAPRRSGARARGARRRRQANSPGASAGRSGSIARAPARANAKGKVRMRRVRDRPSAAGRATGRPRLLARTRRTGAPRLSR